MFKRVVLMPTGDELRAGTVLDTDSPMVMGELLRLNSSGEICRIPPIADQETLITDEILAGIRNGYDLLILIGGSGGGHRYVASLGRDFTQSALDTLLTEKFTTELYGKNGHLWCKLLCGRLDGSVVMNLPGPVEEAQAAIKAFCAVYRNTPDDLRAINAAMADAVKACYG